MKIYHQDIATIEALHDLLHDKHNYDLSFPTLSRSRSLTKRMYTAIDNESVCINKSDLQELRDTLVICSLIDRSGQAKEQSVKIDSIFPFLNGE